MHPHIKLNKAALELEMYREDKRRTVMAICITPYAIDLCFACKIPYINTIPNDDIRPRAHGLSNVPVTLKYG